MVVPRKHRTVVANTHPCGICKAQPYKYICPRCNLRYCSLTCYKDQSHAQCTESFYRSSVMSELQSSPAVLPQDRRKMLGILDRFERQAIDQEQMMDMSEEELLEKLQSQQQQQQQQQMHSSAGAGATLGVGSSDTSGDRNVDANVQRKLTPKERDELIRKAIEEEQHEQGDHAEEQEEMERILEQEYLDLNNRFQGVDLNQESFESIWRRLTPEEQHEFRERFMVMGKMADDDQKHYLQDSEGGEHGEGKPEHEDDDDVEEEQEAKKLLQEMEETMKRSGRRMDINAANTNNDNDNNNNSNSNPILADLDAEDLRALRNAEIAELISLWKPWWEIEGEKAGHLKRVQVSEMVGEEEVSRMKAALVTKGDSALEPAPGSGPSSAPSGKVVDRLVLDEEAMLRSHQALVQDIFELEKEQQEMAASNVGPMVRAPHPSLIYHVCALLFSYVTTSRYLNGDLGEDAEETLRCIFDLCPFFSPPPESAASSAKRTSTSASASLEAGVAPSPQVPEVDDFETTLAVIQRASADSLLWKGDTLRPEMLSVLLRDLTLILARPSRCLKGIRELKQVFEMYLKPSTTIAEGSRHYGPKRIRIFSKSALVRLFKKLEFYESYLMSEQWFLKSDRLDRVRTEVVVTGIRVRQEMEGWTKELESVERVVQTAMTKSAVGESSIKKDSETGALIEELP